MKPTHSALLFRFPCILFSVKPETFYFIIIMIFGSHPVHRYEIIFGVSLLELLTGINNRDDLINKIKRTGKNIELMTGGYGKRIPLFQFFYVSFYSIGCINVFILFEQRSNQHIAMLCWKGT